MSAVVREKFAGLTAFRKQFDNDLHWIPNWLCPAEMFLWFDEPVTLQAQHITGSSALPKMFSQHMSLQLPAAARVMNSVPEHQRTPAWHSVLAAMSCTPDEPIASAGDDSVTQPVLFQYIVTTTTSPPKHLSERPWLASTLYGSPAELRLLGVDL